MKEHRISRRAFHRAAAGAVAAATVGPSLRALAGKAAGARKRPNILLIVTDQQSAHMMSCAGNRRLKTPAMDYLAAHGIRFERAYTTNPVCSPARIGFMTGRFPGAFLSARGGPARENGGAMAVSEISAEVRRTHVGAYLKQAGYELAYVGKVHLPRPLNPKALGFEVLTGDQRDAGAQASADFIRRKHERPYCLIVSLINPHDICYFAINKYRFGQKAEERKGQGGTANRVLLEAMKMPDGVSEEEFLARHCPPLPANHAPQDDEPEAVRKLIELRPFRKAARDSYGEKDWRLHRWAYHRLTERVDRQVQIVLDALRESGQEESTVVILTSDHGDMDGAHKMEHKTVLYEEAARIPFVVMHKGTSPAGRVDEDHLVSNGLDLLPTVCDYAGLPDAKADPRGRSLRPLIEGKAVEDWRPTLGVESQIGRMVVGDRVKYIRYDVGKEQEQLLDLRRDPGETRHFTNDPACAQLLARLRAAYDKDWFPGA